ncbi:MAG: hypothetical protein IT378_17240 [Sandaracinaceae bacterium]|nr:hypothetical protein [Sandaracinaceae bacterium]
MRTVVALLVVLSGCAEPVELSVDVRTSLAAGTEIDRLRVDVTPAGGARSRPFVRFVEAGDDLTTPLRVADFRDLPGGLTRVRAAADYQSVEVLAREVEIDLRADFALTIALTRDCEDLVCPGPGQPAHHTECVEGRCVPRDCGSGSVEPCGDLACTTDAECVLRLDCAIAHCELGMCLCDVPDAGADGGACPGECEVGQTGEETRTCGMCGEGTQRRRRTCSDHCTWGDWQDWLTCETSAACAPGQLDSETRACGNCNRGSQQRERPCDPTSCQWGAWGDFSSCVEGGCAPGATRSGCDPCGHEVCDASCNWGGCTPRPGSACLYQRGSHYRCCGTRQWQYCLSSCQWSTDCSPCTSCCQ